MLMDGYLADPLQLVSRMSDILLEAATLKAAASATGG
jgi:hypothetical protein